MPYETLTAPAPRDGFTFTAELEHDSAMGAPWVEHDGHGPVTDWERRDKAPGEMIIAGDRHGACRFYDFQRACEIARRDGWGPSLYKVSEDTGRYGLVRLTGLYFPNETRGHVGDCETLKTDWHDDRAAAYAQLHEMFRATFPSARAYAAAAAMADFERLKGWCDDEWHWCGVIVKAFRNGIELGSASLWGIESDAGDYLAEVAEELAEQAAQEAQGAVAALCECESEGE